jgi:hypothetical protein
MEDAGANYLYALATLAMTFAGLCAIVMLRPIQGGVASRPWTNCLRVAGFRPRSFSC